MNQIPKNQIRDLISDTLHKVRIFEEKYKQTKELQDKTELTNIYKAFLQELSDSKADLKNFQINLSYTEQNLIQTIIDTIFKIEIPPSKDKQQKAVDLNNALFWETLIQIKDQLINFEKSRTKDKKVTKVEKDQLTKNK